MRNTTRGRKLLGYAAILTIMAWVGVVSAETADEVIDAGIKAIGGMDAIGKVKSVERTGDIALGGEMAQQLGQAGGTQKQVIIPAKKAYQMMDLGIFQQTMGFDGKTAWQNGMTGLQKMEGAEAQQIKILATISPLVSLREKDSKAKVEKVADETVDGADYFVLKMTPAEGGSPYKLYINKSTKMLDQMTTEQDNPQMGPMTVVLKNSDYKDHSGVKLPGKVKMMFGTMISLDTTYKDTKVNGTVDETIFDMPKEGGSNVAPASGGVAPAAGGARGAGAPGAGAPGAGRGAGAPGARSGAPGAGAPRP